MGNQVVNLPVPAGNGVGAAVDVSTFGASKSIVVGGNTQSQITIEVNNDPGQLGGFAPLKTFQNRGGLVVNVACMWMRVRVSNYNPYVGGSSNVDVAGDDSGASFQALAVTVGNGIGAASNTLALPLFKTVQVGGTYRGMTIVEVSEDNVDWDQVFAFGSQSGGIQSAEITAEFMRVRRTGVPQVDPGLPIVNVAATAIPGGGGGGITGIEVDRDGVVVVASATILNFVGTRVIDAGGGEADITPAAIFDAAVGTPDTNIRGSRLTAQSPIDNTKTGITNFGSQTHTQDPAATGATDDYATISGGDDNSASAPYSTVVGGRANVSSDEDAITGGQGNQASGPQNIAMGAFCIADGPASGDDELGGAVAIGHRTVASGVHAFASGTATQALGNGSTAMGAQATASGDHAFAAGNGPVASGDDSAAFNRGTASGIRSFAEGGRFNDASGDAAHVEGGTGVAGGICTASGDQSHAGGIGGVASGAGSFAHGGTASGPKSFAVNTGTASGDRSAALGLGSTASALGAVAVGGTASGQQSFAANSGEASGVQSSVFGQWSVGGARAAFNESEQAFSSFSVNQGKWGKVLYSGKIGGGGGGAATVDLKFGVLSNKELFFDDPVNPAQAMTASFRLFATVSQLQGATNFSGLITLECNAKWDGAGTVTMTGATEGQVAGDPQVASITLVATVVLSGGRPVLRLTLTQGGVVGPTHCDCFVEHVVNAMGNF